MCTLTVVPLSSGTLRVGFNRDESPARPAGLAPRVRQFGDRKAAFPTDPASGGTWLAANDAGLVLAVLNVNLPDRDRTAVYPRSRGEIIPALLGWDSPSAALGACERFHFTDYAPFRLVLIGPDIVSDLRWDGRVPTATSRLVCSAPQLFTSSGLGDHVIDGVRRELFTTLFAGNPDTWEAAQSEFHRHKWPGNEHLSVNMRRPTARTVSHALLDLGRSEVVFVYHAGAPDEPAETTTLKLPLATWAP